MWATFFTVCRATSAPPSRCTMFATPSSTAPRASPGPSKRAAAKFRFNMATNTALLLYTAIAVAGLVFLIVRLKVSAFVALIIASLFVGLAAGMEPARMLKAFQDGVGGVLGSIAAIIGLGTILGKMLAESGGAEIISSRLIALFG